MGLDMYAYVAGRAGQQNDYYEGAEFNEELKDFVNKSVSKPVEIAYWRKHPNLHGWMERLWEHKCNKEGISINDSTFNGIELELTREYLYKLEEDVLNNELTGTTGFFFGNDADEFYRGKDLEFVKNARAELFMGLRVFYNSSW